MQEIPDKARFVAIVLAAIIAVLAIVLIYKEIKRAPPDSLPPGDAAGWNTAHFVGSQQCAGCHQQEAEHWKQSDHHHAMELPSEKSVLGNFNNASFNYFGRKTQFTEKDGRYFVNTEDQQGKLQNFEVAYTLGYKPLQQYLVKFPDGRIQTLPFAWDTRKKEQGGQRWFHLYPKDNITPDNPLFWTRPLQNWNHMCADCHTTNFSKNFIDKTNTFDSRWQEEGNGCESCHGAGSAHVELMQKNTLKNHPDAKLTGLLIHPLKTQTEQMDQCGACHSRRDRLQENPSHEKMTETFRPIFIQPGLYFPDGQIQDEVFISTSFMQSKMYAAGVTCTNCHNPHSTKLKIEGNALCTQCHNTETYDTKQHHFHLENSAGAQCVSCHMPARTYMVVDPRHDHRFSVPRPELSEKIGSPDVCSGCHHKKMPLPKKPENQTSHFGETFWRAQHEQLFADGSNAGPSLKHILLDEKTNAIIKASALMELANYLNPSALQLIVDQLKNPDAMIRLGAVESLNGVSPEQRAPLLLTLLNDPSRAVRLAVAPLIANVDKKTLSSSQLAAVDKVFGEYKRWLEADSDRGTALVSLAGFYLAQGDTVTAKAWFEKALQRDEKSLAAYLNYADYYRSVRNDEAAAALLRKALAIYPDSADAHYAMGLLLVRANQYTPALAELQQAQKLAPDRSQYAYVYGIGLYSSGQQEKGLSVLEKAQAAFPANTQILSALVSYATERRDKARAEKYGAKLQALMAQ